MGKEAETVYIIMNSLAFFRSGCRPHNMIIMKTGISEVSNNIYISIKFLVENNRIKLDDKIIIVNINRFVAFFTLFLVNIIRAVIHILKVIIMIDNESNIILFVVE